MDETAVELIRRAYAAWNADDWETLTALADPNIEWRPALAAERATTYFGVEGVRAYRQDVQSMLGAISTDMSEVLRATPEHVLVRSRVQSHGGESGIQVQQHFVHAWTIRGGRIVAMRSFPTESEALAAVGMATAPPPSPGAARPRRDEAARARPDA
jgi:ketosteroid isomerase-like protein